MKDYFKNLLLALLGRNPFRDEIDELRAHYEKAAERVEVLTGMYYKSLEKFDEISNKMLDYQRLTENLRQRIADYQKQVEDFNKETYRLRANLMVAGKQQENR